MLHACRISTTVDQTWCISRSTVKLNTYEHLEVVDDSMLLKAFSRRAPGGDIPDSFKMLGTISCHIYTSEGTAAMGSACLIMANKAL